MIPSTELVRPEVHDGRHDSFQDGELSPEPQSEEHDEKEDRP